MAENNLAEDSQNSLQEQSRKQSSILPFIILLFALFALSTTAIFIKISVEEISAIATLFNRLWIATIIFSCWNIINEIYSQTDEESTISSQQIYSIRDIALLIAVSVIHLLGRLCWTWALTQTSAANANVLGSLNPLFTTLGGWLFFNQIFGRNFLIGLFLAILGIIGLGFEDLSQSNYSVDGDIAAVISSAFYAVKLLITEQIRNKFSVKIILLCRCIIGTFILIPIVLNFESQIFPVSFSGWLVVFALAAISEALGHGLMVYSLKYFSSGFISLLLLLNPVIVTIIAWILFSENLSIFNLLGLALILAGIGLAISNQKSIKTKVISNNNSLSENES